MKNWTIRARIIGSFGVVLALMVVMALIAYTRLDRIAGQAGTIAGDAVPGLSFSTSLREAWSSSFTKTEQWLLQPDIAGRELLESDLINLRDEMDKLTKSYEATTSEEDRKLFDVFKATRALYTTAQNDVLGPADSKAKLDAALARLNTELLPQYARGTAAINAVVEFNRSNALAATKAMAADIATAKVGVLASFAAALVVALLCGVGLLSVITGPLKRFVPIMNTMRAGDLSGRLTIERDDEFGAVAKGFNQMTDALARLVGQMQLSSGKVATGVTQIAATAKQQQATANEVAATTTEIGATSREIAATSKELVRTMSDVSVVAEQSAMLAGTGQVGLTHMEETIRRLMDAAGSVNAKLATLNEKAGDISQVVTTITKVADQTNLLSLNAAIEAEKAGEYGRGFAVVATEIRRLADQTAVSTYDIGEMVKAMQSSVAAGVMSMDKFSEEVRRGLQSVQDVSGQLSQIIQQVQAVAPRIEAITEGMQAQATGAEQITESLGQLGEAARQTVESLRQSNGAIADLGDAAQGLKSGVSRFAVVQVPSS